MKKYIYVCGTVTIALKAKDILDKNGIPSVVKRTHSGGFGIGCGYGVVVPVSYSEKTKKLLFENGIKIMLAEEYNQ